MITKERVLNATGSELDEMVALAHGWVKTNQKTTFVVWQENLADGGIVEKWYKYHPTTNGTQCMEIMGREKIEAKPKTEGWFAKIDNDDCFASSRGETAMIAICRCFVLSKWEVINGIK